MEYSSLILLLVSILNTNEWAKLQFKRKHPTPSILNPPTAELARIRCFKDIYNTEGPYRGAFFPLSADSNFNLFKKKFRPARILWNGDLMRRHPFRRCFPVFHCLAFVFSRLLLFFLLLLSSVFSFLPMFHELCPSGCCH